MIAQIVSCLVLAVGVRAPLAGEPGEVPIRIHQGHLVVARGSIGSLTGLQLLVDTGSMPSVVDVRVARKLRLQTRPTTFIAFGKTVRAETALLEGFAIGPLRSGPAPALVTDLSSAGGLRLDAIVGLDVLARRSFRIDYAARVLTLSPTGREDWTAPLEVVWPFLTARLVVGGQPVRLLIDTGSAEIVLFRSRLPAAVPGARWKGDKTVQYASGAARLQHFELRDAALGERRWDRLEGWALDQLPRGYPEAIDGILGVDALGCRRLRFDFERKELGCSE